MVHILIGMKTTWEERLKAKPWSMLLYEWSTNFILEWKSFWYHENSRLGPGKLVPFLLRFLKSIDLFAFLFQYFFSYLEKSYAAFMMGQELDELGEYDQEFIENISKCF